MGRAVEAVAPDPEAAGPDVQRMFRMDRIANPRVISRRFTPSIDVVDEMLEDEPYVAVGDSDAWP